MQYKLPSQLQCVQGSMNLLLQLTQIYSSQQIKPPPHAKREGQGNKNKKNKTRPMQNARGRTILIKNKNKTRPMQNARGGAPMLCGGGGGGGCGCALLASLVEQSLNYKQKVR
jgi:hypothetical protein